jgi:hypothetical protein
VAGNAYFEAVLRKPLDLPMKVARAFLADLRAYHAEPNAIKRDEIAARRAWLINQRGSSTNVSGRPSNFRRTTSSRCSSGCRIFYDRAVPAMP